MPLIPELRGSFVALSIAVIVFSTSRLAHADPDAPCIPRGALRVDVEPAPNDKALSRRTLEQIFSELAENASACEGASDEAPSPSIFVEWLPPHRARVRVVLQTKRKDYEIQRNLELDGVPADGVPLAVAIAADELVVALFDRAASEAIEPPRSPVKVVPPPVAPRPVIPEPALPRLLFGLRLGFEQLTSGLGMSGPDARIAFVVTRHAEVVLHGGLRLPWLIDDPGRTPSSASRFGTEVRLGTDVRGDLGISGSIGIDAAFAAQEARAIPTVGVALWKGLGDRFVLTLDLHLGAAVSSSATLLRGLEFGTGIGIDTSW
ncbi:hypothetical protein BH09MYX1_BH09MYX1_31810 [soil metagenome]